MVEYELELVSQHPALPAQNPLSTCSKPRTTSNTLKHCFSLQIQTVAAKNLPNLEHIKEKESRGLQLSALLHIIFKVRVPGGTLPLLDMHLALSEPAHRLLDLIGIPHWDERQGHKLLGHIEHLAEVLGPLFPRPYPGPARGKPLGMHRKQEVLHACPHVLLPEDTEPLGGRVAHEEHPGLGSGAHVSVMVVSGYLIEHLPVHDHYEVPAQLCARAWRGHGSAQGLLQRSFGYGRVLEFPYAPPAHDGFERVHYIFLLFILREFAAGEGDSVFKLFVERAELLEVKRLRPVARGVLRVGMHLYHEAVRPDYYCRLAHGGHERAHARGVARVEDHRQVAQAFYVRDDGQVRGVAGGGLEGAYAALAEDDAGVAAHHDVLGRGYPLLHGGREPALEDHGAPGAPDLLEEIEVLHVPGPYLEDVHVLGHEAYVLRAHDLGDRGNCRGLAHLGKELYAFFAHALEAVRARARLVRAPAEHGHAEFFEIARGLHDLVAALDGAGAGYHEEGIPASDSETFFDPDDRITGMEVPAYEFIGFCDVDDLEDAGELCEGGLVHPALVAYDADGGAVRAGHDLCLEAEALDGVLHFADIALCGIVVHDDEHGPRPPVSDATFYMMGGDVDQRGELVYSGIRYG